jgi:BMFP domain-containing protein YqiC
MLDSKFLKDLAQQAASMLPPAFKELKSEFEQHCHTALQSAFSRLKLVTREEFEVQSHLLASLQAKIQRLEQKLNSLQADKPFASDVPLSPLHSESPCSASSVTPPDNLPPKD